MIFFGFTVSLTVKTFWVHCEFHCESFLGARCVSPSVALCTVALRRHTEISLLTCQLSRATTRGLRGLVARGSRSPGVVGLRIDPWARALAGAGACGIGGWLARGFLGLVDVCIHGLFDGWSRGGRVFL